MLFGSALGIHWISACTFNYFDLRRVSETRTEKRSLVKEKQNLKNSKMKMLKKLKE
jgi:hypothetical protein